MKVMKPKAIHEDLSPFEEEALQNLKNDPVVYKIISEQLHLSVAEVRLALATLIDYQEDVHYCENCPGLEACAKLYPKHVMTLHKEGHFVERAFEPCKKQEKKDEASMLYALRDFNDEWLDKDLRNVDKSAGRKEIVSLMARIAKGESDRWIYLYGNHRSGKSFFAATFANTLGSKAGYRGMCFCSASSLIDELKRRSFDDKKGFETMMQTLEQAPLLVLDEFGNEFKSDFVFSSILFPLIHFRAQEGKLTVFTSDFKIDEVISMYSPKIGPARAKQFNDLLLGQCKKEFDISGAPLY